MSRAAVVVQALSPTCDGTAPTIELVDTVERLSSLHNDWRRLHNDARHNSIFSSWEWQSLWWRHYGHVDGLRILVAKNGGRIAGILPLYVRRENVCGVSTRVLRLIGTGGDTSPDYLGPLLERENEDTVCAQLVNHIFTELDGWDVAHFSDVHLGTCFTAATRHFAERRGLSCYSHEPRHIPVIELPASWEQYLAGFGRDRRNRIRRLRRKLEADLAARFYVWDDPQTLNAAIAQLIALHRLRWQHRENGGAFRSAAYVGLHSDVIRDCFARGWIRLYCLDIGGRLAAMYYCYRFRNEIFYFQSGFDPAFEAYSPGQALLGFAVEHAIAEGNRVFDLLKGDHHYKFQWATGNRETAGLSIYRPTLAGRMAELRWQTAPATARTLRRWIGIGQPLDHVAGPKQGITISTPQGDQ